MFLYGKNSVAERLKVNPQSIKTIFLQDNFSSPRIEELIKAKNISVKRVSQKKLHKIKNAEVLQGIIAEVEDFKYVYFEDLLGTFKKQPLSLIFLDRVFDPQNLGSIVRVSACFGNFAIVIPKYKACEVTDVVLHVASGGENYTPISMASNLSNALLEAKEAGYWAIGAVVDGGKDISQVDLPFPLCLILGSEGSGIRYGLEKHLDFKVQIPMLGAPISFNITAACAIFCHEIAKKAPKIR